MATINVTDAISQDRTKDLKSFDERKTGVRGLINEGTKTLPAIFVRPIEDVSNDYGTCSENLSVPIIDIGDLGDYSSEKTSEIVKQISWAAENWGFFQVINHGIPLELLDRMIEGAGMFHEQDDEIKKQYYSRNKSDSVRFVSNFDLYKSNAANWRDTFSVDTTRTGLLPTELPYICKEVIKEYIKEVLKLGDVVLRLLSMGLGLKEDYLKEMESSKGWNFTCHYYPACPEPELTLGTSKHADASFITILLQDQIGGLQFLHQNKWVNVEPVQGALIVNIGDMLQIISNDKLKSVYHRVIAKSIGPRNSVALHFKGLFSSPRLYGPIKDLISDQNPPLYREFTIQEFLTNFISKPLDKPGLDHFKFKL